MKKFQLSKFETISLILAILVLLILFISSSMTYNEQKMSSSVINARFGIIENLIKNWNIYYGGVWHNRISDHGIAGFTQFFVRKLAHFTTYFFLGFFLTGAMKRLFRLKWTWPIFTWFMVVTMAALDEYHQFLTGDRTPSVHDVMLDGAGGIFGIILCLLILKVYHLDFFKKK